MLTRTGQELVRSRCFDTVRVCRVHRAHARVCMVVCAVPVLGLCLKPPNAVLQSFCLLGSGDWCGVVHFAVALRRSPAMSLAVASHQPRGVDERPGSGRGSSPREATAKALDVPTNPALAQAMATTSAARDKVEFLIYAAQRHQDYAKGYLPRVLGNDPTLLELDLQRTHLTDVSLATLADALRLNSVLTSLNLADNYIEHDGGMALAEMLEFNSTLQQLNVGDNDLGPPACLRMIQVRLPPGFLWKSVGSIHCTGSRNGSARGGGRGCNDNTF